MGPGPGCGPDRAPRHYDLAPWPPSELSQLRTLASGLDHPEGVALGPDGLLYAGGEAGQIYRIDPAAAGGHEQIADTGGLVFGLCLDRRGSIYACDYGNRAVMRIDRCRPAPWSRGATPPAVPSL